MVDEYVVAEENLVEIIHKGIPTVSLLLKSLTMASLGYLYSLLTLINFDPVSFSTHRSTPEANHKALFVFGDSLFDAGNNQYLNTSVEGSAVIWPYGETYFDHPTGRISDGRILPDFIAQFANLPLPPPYLEPGSHQFSDGTNFASAGAGVLPETQPGTEVYDLGGRKIAFQNVAPLGCIPTVKSGNPEVGSKCLEEPLKLARLHNRALSVALKKLESHLPGFKYSIFDYYNALGDRVNNPSIYGFKNGTSACCGSGAFRGSSCGTEPYELCSNPSEYVWFDGGHTTETANFQLAELIWSGPSNVTGPYTMKQLFEQS
ncbi:GDSL esterase/lipase 1-like isoform X5 [Argentina anserina]|uniref:GDSL esterase/lipase 1-like isoform X5 n=1 Tax=Argentina anserina TaxID=57926 RepID=UPI0021762357|nr:GDSL esterase/lipase 1-like isoform X5 [Potentilla anserina]